MNTDRIKKIVVWMLCATLTCANMQMMNIQAGVSTKQQVTEATSGIRNTVDTKDRIKINLFNYRGKEDRNDYKPGISRDGGLQFFYTSYTDGQDYNGYTNGNMVHPGIVKHLLDSNGFPVLAVGNGESLGYLFNEDKNVQGKISTNLGANHLFTQDADGYYSFDSNSDCAVLDTQSNDFTLYDWNSYGQIRNPRKSYSTGFYPYSTGKDNSDENMASYGMNIGVDFLQPKGGTIKGNDMKFDFSGDDDVWVFIDGILVLDLGGIHQAADGYINFKTGEVSGQPTSTQNPPNTDTTLYKAFQASGKYSEKELESIFDITRNAGGEVTAAPFADYTRHRMEFFYLERGGDASNCKIKFNLPAIPTKAITVTKQVTALESGAKIDADQDYSFQLFTGDSASTCNTLCNETYKIFNNAVDTGQTGTVDSSGIFKLKSGQSAVFPHIADGTYYRVRELNPGSDYTVYVNGEQTNAGQDEQNNACFDSKVTSIDEKGEVLFHNVYNKLNYNLQAHKTVQLKNWDDRTYGITLDTYNTTKTEKLVDVALVLDVSGSMTWLMDSEVSKDDLIDLSGINPSDADLNNLKKQAGWDLKYYAKNNKGEYQPIAYQGNNTGSGGTWYFISGDSSQKVIDKSNGMPSESEKVYVKKGSDQTKLGALKANLSVLLKNLRALSPNSKVSIVTFAKSASVYRGLAAASSFTDEEIEKLVNGLDDCIAGGTNQQNGLSLAKNTLSTDAECEKDMILLTDGMPNASGVTADTIKNVASTISSANNTVLYTIGFMSRSNPDFQTLGNDLRSWASGQNGMWNGITTSFINASNAELNDAFGNIWAAIGSSIKVTVKDYIDSRFDVDPNSVAQAGGTVATDERGTYVLWQNVNASFGSDNSPAWVRTFVVKAKKEFIGGNNITTNGDASAVTAVDGTVVKLEQPIVNVKVRFGANNAEDTIFKGTTVASCYNTSLNGEDLRSRLFDANQVTYQSADGTVTFNHAWTDDSAFVYSWYKAVPAGTPESEEFTVGGTICHGVPVQLTDVLKSGEDSVYYMRTGYQPASSVPSALANSTLNGVAYEVTQENAYAYSTYTVHVVAGEITITKNFDKEYLSNIGYTTEQKQLVDAKQSVVITIAKYAPEDTACTGNVIETYKTVITYQAKDGKDTETAKVTGLGIGNYKVMEDTNWSWKYSLKETHDSYENGADGILFIGKKQQNGYFGQMGISNKDSYATVTFTNQLNSAMKWFADTCNVMNTLVSQ